MRSYCLESGTEESGAIVHELDCSSYDLGSLLGSGRLVSLGDFENAMVALDAVKAHHPDAVQCVDCCRPAVILSLPTPGRKTLNLVA